MSSTAETSVRRALDAATDDATRALRGNELALVLLRAGQHAESAAAASAVLNLGLPNDDPSAVKALFRRGQARMELGDLRGARDDMKQAQANADTLTQQSIVNVLYSVDAALSSGLVPVSTTRRGRKQLRHWLLRWRKEVCRGRERSLLAQRLRVTLGVATPRQQLRQVLLAWRGVSVKPGTNSHRMQRRRQLAESFMRSHRHALLDAALSGWAEAVASAVWLPRASARRAGLRQAMTKEMWQLYWQNAAVKRVRARWFPPYFAAWQEATRQGAPERRRRLREATAEARWDSFTHQDKRSKELEPEPEPELEP
jgi:hypothetical protein